MTEQIWEKKCIVDDCENIALLSSSFCAIHRKLKEQEDSEMNRKTKQ